MRRKMSGNLGLYEYSWPASVYVTVNLRIQEFAKFQKIQGYTDSPGKFMNSLKFHGIHEFTRI